MNDIFTCFAQLPPSIKGAVEPDENGDYTIFINSLYNNEQIHEIFNHEMRHILLNHHGSAQPVARLEEEANRHTLLEKIKKAESEGLPLATALLAPRQNAEGEAAPRPTQKAESPAPLQPPMADSRLLALETQLEEIEQELAAEAARTLPWQAGQWVRKPPSSPNG